MAVMSQEEIQRIETQKEYDKGFLRLVKAKYSLKYKAPQIEMMSASILRELEKIYKYLEEQDQVEYRKDLIARLKAADEE